MNIDTICHSFNGLDNFDEIIPVNFDKQDGDFSFESDFLPDDLIACLMSSLELIMIVIMVWIIIPIKTSANGCNSPVEMQLFSTYHDGGV